MAEKRYKAKVVIPLYRTDLPAEDMASLRNTFAQLSSWPVALLVPRGLDLCGLRDELPPFERVEVPDEWLGTKNGIQGYNSMMLDKGFYDLFADCEYILICHTDAWIFRDELDYWCRRGYDCVAAPWVRRPVYDLPVISTFAKWHRKVSERRNKMTRADLYGKVGNGGLSLRRVDAFATACTEYAAEAEHFRRESGHLFNEDVFWATVPQKFIYPSQDEALAFAFDTHPAYCYKVRGGQLPFGCHAWSKPRYRKFWDKIISL